MLTKVICSVQWWTAKQSHRFTYEDVTQSIRYFAVIKRVNIMPMAIFQEVLVQQRIETNWKVMLTAESNKVELFSGKRQFDKFSSLMAMPKESSRMKFSKQRKARSWLSKIIIWKLFHYIWKYHYIFPLYGKSSVRTNGQPVLLDTSFHWIASFSFPN